MSNEEIAQKVAQLMGKILDVDIDPTVLDRNLVQEYGANSMDVVDIVDKIERTFGIEINNEQTKGLKTFGDAVTLVSQLAGATS